MKTERQYPKIIITKKGERWTDSGHPWVYESDIVSTEPVSEEKNGCICDVMTENGKYAGSGFISLKSKIRARIISRNANDKFDEAFWRRRICYAIDYRLNVMGEETDAMRIIFGESDGFPGLTVDKFHDILVVQILSVGIEKIKSLIFRLLFDEMNKKGLKISGIYERNDVLIRELEGLSQYKDWAEGFESPGSTKTIICENGIKYNVDFENGQKTGFFLDQKFNRRAAASIAKDKNVLDCFTHTGSFALNAAKGGASRVTAVDISQSALDNAIENAKLNNLDGKIDFTAADIFDYLPALIEKGGHPFDYIILDPPAFTKSGKTADNAEKGYKKINYLAMRLLPRGGYFATCSCSHFMPHERFEKMLGEAAKEAGVSLKQIEMRQQACDHPIMRNVPETDYLKFYLFQIC